MLGFVRSAITPVARPLGGRIASQKARTAPRKLSLVTKRQFCNKHHELVPGSKASFKLFMDIANSTPVAPIDKHEKILTINDLEVSREAATVNGRLRHLVNIDASYEEACQVALEATLEGVELDMHSYIYLSTLYKRELPKYYEGLQNLAKTQIQAFYDTWTPLASEIATYMRAVTPSDASATSNVAATMVNAESSPFIDLSFQAMLDRIRRRKSKLDVDALTAIAEAHTRLGLDYNPYINSLHNDYILDTPTYDTFRRLHPQ